jgi:hypothetical protein
LGSEPASWRSTWFAAMESGSLRFQFGCPAALAMPALRIGISTAL